MSADKSDKLPLDFRPHEEAMAIASMLFEEIDPENYYESIGTGDAKVTRLMEWVDDQAKADRFEYHLPLILQVFRCIEDMILDSKRERK